MYTESSYPAYNDKQKFQNFKQKMSNIQKTCVDVSYYVISFLSFISNNSCIISYIKFVEYMSKKFIYM